MAPRKPFELRSEEAKTASLVIMNHDGDDSTPQIQCLFAIVVLWHEQLRDNIDDTGLIWSKVGGELRTVELTSLAVPFIKYCFACSTKRGRLTSFEEMFEVFRRRTILVGIDRKI